MDRNKAHVFGLSDMQEVVRDQVNITTPGQALVRKVVAGSGLVDTSTGVDEGTGDVVVALPLIPGTQGVSWSSVTTDEHGRVVGGVVGIGNTLPIATPSTLGCVKVGYGLAITADGVLYNTGTGGGGGYILPYASPTVLGGVKVGSGLSIDGSGVLSSTYSYTLPQATAAVLGGVRIGTGLAVDAGTVSFDSSVLSSFAGSSAITTTGIITTGTWRGSVVAPAYGGTGFGSYAVGDILYANSTTTLARFSPSGTGTLKWNGSAWSLDTTSYQAQSQRLTDFSGLGNPSVSGYVLSATTSGVLSWIAAGSGSGSVTSVALSAPSLFTVTGSPVTGTGTLAFAFNDTNTNFILGDGSVVARSTYLTTSSASSTYQPLDADLTSIAGLAGTTGWLKKTAANTWALDTSTFLTANQTITLSGLVTGSGTTAITTTIADAALSIAKTSGLQTALDAKMATASYPDIVAIEALAGTSGLLKKTAANTWSLDTTTYQTQATNLTTLATLGNPASNGYVLSSTTAGVMSWIPVSGGGGTVTSVALSAPSLFTVSGSPVATTGTLTFAWNGSSSNLVRADGSTVASSSYQAAATNLATFAALGSPSSNGYVLSSTTAGVMSWIPVSGGGGTVTNVALSAPSIFTVSGSPVTTTGTLSFAWNGTSANFVLGDGTTTAVSGFLTTSAASSAYQPLDADLTSIAGLAGTSGWLKKTAANTWALDTSTFLTANQSITLSGDASGSGATSIAVAVNKILGNSIPANAAGALTNNGTGTLSWVSYLTTAPTITLTGDVTGSGTGSFATSISAATVTGKLLTGYTVGSNAVLAATDTVLGAFGKVQAQLNSKASSAPGIESTGLYSWSSPYLSIASSTTFNVGAVSGQIVDTTTTPGTPIITQISYAGQSGVTDAYVTTSITTYVYIDNTGTLRQSATALTPAQRRSNLYLGIIAHPLKTTLTSVDICPDICTSVMSQNRDMWNALHYINDGIKVSANGANLNINVSGGKLYGMGINFSVDPLTPMQRSVGPYTAATFKYRLQDGTTYANTTSINPAQYDNAGTLTAVGGGSGSSTNQRVYSTSYGQLLIQYGQTVYSNLDLAVASIPNETFAVPVDAAANLILIGVISVNKNATSLNDITQAKFVPASKFGEISSGSSGSTVATFQNIYNNSTVPQVTTNSAIGALVVHRGSTSDTDVVFAITNGAGTSTASITGAGTITGTKFVTSGSSSSYFVLGDGSTVATSTYLTTSAASSSYQPLDGDLTAIAALAGTTGLARKTAANTWSLDTNTYLTGNQSITLSGDVTGTGTTAITASIAAATVTGKALTGYAVGTNAVLAATDTVLAAFGKLQAQVTAVPGTVTSVGLTAPALMTTSGSPVTGAGTLALSWNGSSSNLVRADGSTVASSTYQTAATNLATLAALGNPASNGYVLSSTTAGVMSWIPVSGGGGTVTSVALSAPSIFTVTGSPITTTGTLTFAWNGSASNFVLGDGTTTAVSGFLTTATAASTYQPLDADLTSIAGLAGTSGWLKKTAANTWALDTSTFLTANQSITWTGSGDVSGSASGATSISPSVTVTGIQGKAITLATGLLKYNGTAFSFDASAYLTANQSITLSGDASGTGTTAITVAVNKLLGNSIPANAAGALTNNGTGTLSWTAYLTAATASSTYQPLNSALTAFAGLGNPASNGYVLSSTTAGVLSWVATSSGAGTVTSVALSAPSLFTVSGSPVTSTGTLSFAWNGASTNLVRADGSTVAASTYLTGNQSITLSGAVTGTGATAITTTLSASAVALSNMANLAANSVIGNLTGSAATPVAVSVASAATASTVVVRDANAMAAFANVLEGYVATVTAAGTTTLTVASAYQQYFTGTSTQTVTLPVTSTLVVGHQFLLQNNSTGAVTIQSSGANTVVILASGTGCLVTCILASGTTASSWSYSYAGTSTASGKKFTSNNTITLSGTDGTTHTLPTTSSTVARTDAAQTFSGDQTFSGRQILTASGTTPATSAVLVSSSNPNIFLQNTSGSTDGKNWRIGVASDTFTIVSMNDAGNTYTPVLAATRSGTTLSSLSIGYSGSTLNLGAFNTGSVSGILQAAPTGNVTRLAPPSTDGYVLASTTAGVLSWVAPGSGGMANPMTTTGDMIYSSSGSTPARLAIGTTNQVLIGGSTPTWSSTLTLGGKLTVPASGTGSAGFSLQQGVTPTTPGNGDFWITSSGVYAQVAGSTLKLNANGALYYSSTAAVYVSNTTTAGSLGATSLTSAAMTPGNVVSVLADGYVKYNTLSDTVTLTVRVATTDITFTVPGTSIPSGIVNTNYHWKLDGRLTPATGPGAGSTVKFFGRFSVVGTGAEYISDISQSMTIDTSTSITFDLRAQWSGTGANNSIGSEYMVVQQINSIGGGGGSVISVALSTPSIFTVTGSPITSSGTLGFSWNGSSSNLVRADGSTIASSSFQPSSPTLTNFSSLGNPSTSGYVLSSTTSGVLSWVASGGFAGSTTNGVAYYNGTSLTNSSNLTYNGSYITSQGASFGINTSLSGWAWFGSSAFGGAANYPGFWQSHTTGELGLWAAAGTQISFADATVGDIAKLNSSGFHPYTDNVVSLGTPSSNWANVYAVSGKFSYTVLGYQEIATAGATTTLTSASPYSTAFTGTTTQICVLPNATTLVVGRRIELDNNSTGLVTVNTNGGATLLILAAGTVVRLTCTSIATAAGTWEYDYIGAIVASGKKFVSNNTLTLTGTDGTSHTLPSTNSVLARTDSDQTFSGAQTFSGNVYYGPGSLSFIPAAPLNMLASSYGTIKTQINVINTGGGGGAGAAIDFFTYDISGGTTPGMRLAAVDDNNYSAAFVVYTKNPGAAGNALSERFRITAAGVGTLPGGLTCSAGGIGYATGAGGTVTQGTSKSTGVTLSKLCGTITMNAAALANSATVSFKLTNTFIAATDVVVVQHASAGTLGAYNFAVAPAAGSAVISVRNVHTASLSEAIVLRFIILKAVVT